MLGINEIRTPLKLTDYMKRGNPMRNLVNDIYDVVEFIFEEASTPSREKFVSNPNEPFVGVYLNLGDKIISTWGKKTIKLNPLYYAFAYLPNTSCESFVFGDSHRSLGIHMNPKFFSGEEFVVNYTFLCEFLRRFNATEPEPFFSPPIKMSERMIAAVGDLRTTKFKGSIADELYLAKAFELIHFALDEIELRVIFGDGGPVINPSPIFKEFREFIEKYFYMEFNNRSLGALAGMDVKTFHTLFKTRYGMTPLQFLQEVRMKKALALLKTYPDLSVDKACTTVGLKTPKLFRKVSNMDFL